MAGEVIESHLDPKSGAFQRNDAHNRALAAELRERLALVCQGGGAKYQARQRVPEARLRLMGNAPPSELKAPAGAHVQVTGRVEDVSPEYAAADVFVCGLRVGAGIKNKVLEALAMGCPVVATPISLNGIDAQQHDAALLADAHAESFAAALARALSNDALRARLAGSGRAFVEMRYSWEGVAAQYERLYQRVIEETQ